MSKKNRTKPNNDTDSKAWDNSLPLKTEKNRRYPARDLYHRRNLTKRTKRNVEEVKKKCQKSKSMPHVLCLQHQK